MKAVFILLVVMGAALAHAADDKTAPAEDAVSAQDWGDYDDETTCENWVPKVYKGYK